MNILELWAGLHKVALLGTERAGEMLALPQDAPASLREALHEDREGALLSLLATASLQRRAGQEPSVLEQLNAAPSTCKPESYDLAPRAACARLRGLSSVEGALLHEWLSVARSQHVLAPPDALPNLLRLGSRSKALRPALLAIMGNRGRWLAEQNPEWKWARGEAVDEQAAFKEAVCTFREGQGEARTSAFALLRSSDAERARQILEATWPHESAADREKWIEMLRPELSSQDEPFLEDALDDRASGVRKMAAQVFVTLPNSAFMARAIERASKYLGARRKEGVLHLEADLPLAWNEEWARDGIEKDGVRGQASAAGCGATGQRMWWLVQIISCTPPAFWVAQWKAKPIEILEAALRDEPALLEGLALAAIRAGDEAWITALLLSPLTRQSIPRLPPGVLLARLEAGAREALLTEIVGEVQDSSDAALLHSALALLTSHPGAWGLELSQVVLGWMRAIARRAVEEAKLKSLNQWQFAGGHVLHRAPEFAPLMHMEALATADQDWPSDAPTFVQDARDALLEAYETRRDLRLEFEM